MIEAVAASAIGLTSIGLNVWLVVKYARAVEHGASVEVAQAHSEGEQTRITYELEVTTKALAAEQRRSAALQEVLDDVSKAPIGIGLSDADWRGRLLRITQQWGDAAEVHLSAERQPGRLPADPAAVAPEAAPLSPVGDVLR